jgi:diaminohydroxyphosphoribosylaminopyrimidine deaminase/5-amino-6-(5-phosphoribosylamino)uracil reductase
LPQLSQLGITSILVEGGAKVQSSFIEAGLFNQIVLYIAPKLIGGINAPGFFDSLGFQELAQAVKLNFTSIEMLGADLKIVAVPTR